MSDTALKYKPGSLVKARGREWVVEPSTDEGLLRLRPLGGTAEDVQVILPELEQAPVESASFPLPDVTKPGPYHSALLLRDALLMKFRAGAGPFRSFGGIAVEPRAYQLVPLLMALKQKTVRLLIADDVGIGKTIEAALILRELLDRGEIERFAVLCPPHLVEQWIAELRTRFHIQAVGLTASSVNRLERETPRGLSLFQYYEAVVISLDYIKSDTHRTYFLANPPEMILVDEAHTCTSLGQGRQLRYELLKELCKDEKRHLIMLTATPHSGNESGFYHLLSLIKPDFALLAPGADAAIDKTKLRQELSTHFVQRRRIDIDEWHDTSLFPRRKTKEETYKLSGPWEVFFERVRLYCLDLAQRAENETGRQAGVMWYAVFALLRCVSSSPDAARRALTTRLQGTSGEMLALADEERISDGVGEEMVSNDEEPPAAIGGKEEAGLLSELIEKAEALRGIAKDPKLACLVRQIEALVTASPRFKPVVFCRYIATARYVAEQLGAYFNGKRDGTAKDIQVACVTGELTADEREEQIEKLVEEAELPVLVATDCLSEGINLQHGFDAVIHYDLAWNPTRHEQREGRVDRFGQKSKEVRCVMLYGENNPVDGLIFNVILKKARIIKQDLGILVPIPEDERKIQTALVKAALMKSASSSAVVQGELNFGDDDPDIETISGKWQDALEKARANHTIFAQRRLKPEDVLPEWEKQAEIFGQDKDVEEFVKHTLHIVNAPVGEVKGRPSSWRFSPEYLPASLKSRVEGEGYGKPIRVGFHYPPDKGSVFIHRSHPVVSILADHILENALEEKNSASDAMLARRCGVFESKSVDQVTAIFLVRLRHQIEIVRGRKTKNIVAEEALLLGCQGRSTAKPLDKAAVESLLKGQPSGNLAPQTIERELKITLEWFTNNNAWFETVARDRSAALLADHRRVREASEDTGTFTVTPSLPVDLIGLYVLLPERL
jgi:ERCC4-related helicase